VIHDVFLPTLSGLTAFVITSHFRGYKRFYKRTLLEESDFLKNDCLVMNCTVGVVKNRIETPKDIQIHVPRSDMGRCFKELLSRCIGCDITFEVRDEKVRAHKWILAARSPVFKAQFFGPIGKPDLHTVVVEDVEPVVFKVIATCRSHHFPYIFSVLYCSRDLSEAVNLLIFGRDA
jgi:hypothetical protein